MVMMVKLEIGYNLIEVFSFGLGVITFSEANGLL
jgi:hypothetical protein